MVDVCSVGDFFMLLLDVLKDKNNSSGFMNRNSFYLGEPLIC